MARSLYKASLAFAPLVLFAEYVLHVSGTTLFVLAACALIPLAYLIGEAAEHVAEHTGSKIGGFLNASFGNAPELIISLFAIRDSLPAVVLGSITGSVVSCALLVLGAAGASYVWQWSERKAKVHPRDIQVPRSPEQRG